MIYHSKQERLLYSGVQGRLPARIYRENMTIFESFDGGEVSQLTRKHTYIKHLLLIPSTSLPLVAYASRS